MGRCYSKGLQQLSLIRVLTQLSRKLLVLT